MFDEKELEELKDEALKQIDNTANSEQLYEVKVTFLGKKGKITSMMKALGGMSADDRKNAGQKFNAVKEAIQKALERKEVLLKKQEINIRIVSETLDVTLPVRSEKKGHIHPISHAMEELTTIFASMGFVIAEGPDIEDDWHNFTALNFPPHHPAREMQDTFFMSRGEDNERKVLRTHTSPVQIRYMENNKPPIKIVSMGRTYRSDYDATHTPMFHQMECLYVDRNVNMGHLKGCLTDFVRAYFEIDELPIRFRPSFFPFVEPGAEVDIGCTRKNGELKIARAENPAEQQWLEILGSGMVHPNVLSNCGIDPEEYQGFAFGLGIERIAMLKYGIPDLRTFFESDIRWLSHYGFKDHETPNRAFGA